MEPENQPTPPSQEEQGPANPGRRTAIKAGVGAAAVLVTLTSRPALAATAYSASGTNNETPNELMDQDRFMASRQHKQNRSA